MKSWTERAGSTKPELMTNWNEKHAINIKMIVEIKMYNHVKHEIKIIIKKYLSKKLEERRNILDL